MAGLLDYLSYAANPLGNAAYGLLSNIAPPVLNFYKNQTVGPDAGGPQMSPMGDSYGQASVPFAPAPTYPQGTDPMTAGGVPSAFSSGASPVPFASPPAASQPSLPNPIAIGGGQNPYMMPRLGNADLYEPQQVNTPSNAQPAQGQLPQPQQSLPPAFGRNGDSFLDRLNSGLQSIGNGGSIIGAITGNQTDPQAIGQQNLRAQYFSLRDALVQSGMSPQEANSKAMIGVLNPKAGESIFAQAFGAKEPPKNVEEFAVRNAWENRNRPGAANTSGLPTTAQGLQDWKTAEKAAEKKAITIAEEQGKMAASLPDTLARAENTIKQLDELKAHPAKGYRTGFLSLAPGVPGTAGVDFDERVKQIKGGAFLDAYKMLRGTGAISEAEGVKAEAAQARLSQAKNQKDFDTALDDLRQVVVDGYARAQKQAGEEKVKPYEMPIGQSRTIGGVTIKRVN